METPWRVKVISCSFRSKRHLILPPLLKPPSRRTCLIIISKLFFTALPIPSSNTVCVCVCVRVCVVSVTVKRPVLPPNDGRSRNPLYYYYYYMSQSSQKMVLGTSRLGTPGTASMKCTKPLVTPTSGLTTRALT